MQGIGYSFLLLTIFCYFAFKDVSGLENPIDSDLLSAVNLTLDNNPFEQQLRSKCNENGGDKAYDVLVESLGNLRTCLESNFDVEVFEQEIAEKRKTGDMDEVFSKYCGRVPTIKACVETSAQAFEKCLLDSDKANLRLVLNITEDLVNFGCYKDGDRIAMFIEEGGPECLKSRKTDLEKCKDDLIEGVDLPNLLNELPLLTNFTGGCSKYTTLQNCVVTTLEMCQDVIAANIVEALFRYIRRLTPCKNHKS